MPPPDLVVGWWQPKNRDATAGESNHPVGFFSPFMGRCGPVFGYGEKRFGEGGGVVMVDFVKEERF